MSVTAADDDPHEGVHRSYASVSPPFTPKTCPLMKPAAIRCKKYDRLGDILPRACMPGGIARGDRSAASRSGSLVADVARLDDINRNSVACFFDGQRPSERDDRRLRSGVERLVEGRERHVRAVHPEKDQPPETCVRASTAAPRAPAQPHSRNFRRPWRGSRRSASRAERRNNDRPDDVHENLDRPALGSDAHTNDSPPRRATRPHGMAIASVSYSRTRESVSSGGVPPGR